MKNFFHIKSEVFKLQIKVFKAATMREAMAAMKAELGEDAVILHSKKYKEGGLLGLGSKEIVEITAAIEEESLPKKESDIRPAPRPTLVANTISKYKTSGTAQGVAQAQQQIENLNSETPRPNLSTADSPRITQLEELADKVISRNRTPSLRQNSDAEKVHTFEDVLNEIGDKPVEVESKSDAEILNESAEIIEDKKVAPYNEAVESEEENLAPSPEEFILPTEEEKNSEEVFESEPEENESEEVAEESPEENSETVAQTEETEQAEENSAPTEEEFVYSEGEATEEVDEEPEPTEQAEQPTENSQPQQEQPQQNYTQVPPTELTPEQLAQAQAMMFAQFNQMQMAQVMQQAVAQAQAQAQAQVAEMAEQMREIHRKRLEESGKAPTPQTPTAQSEQENQEKIQRLEDEVAHMKALLAEVLGKENKKGDISLHEALRRQEVDEDILTEMATHAGAGDTLVDSKSKAAKGTLSAYLNEHLRFSDGIKLNRHGVRIVALLGTTGVGKTTTLAKIAAKFVLEHGISAALITADTYRISAVDQLKTYSDILGLPLEIVYTPAELSAAIEKHKNKELILIDTAGRSQQNEFQMRELEEFLRVNPRIEKHLVISATTKLTDAKEIMNKFSAVVPEKVIFTKIDETSTLGMIINLLRNQKLALSYVTTGQSVPDDIDQATADVLTDLLLNKFRD